MPNYVRARWGRTYFFTVVAHNRQRILCNPENVTALRNAFKTVMQKRLFEMDAVVVLPDHMHCIWTLPEGDSDYSARWSIVKRTFTQCVNETVRMAHPTVSRVKRREGSVWQRRFWEHQIRDELDYRMHCDYIHYNPVKHGLTCAPKDWLHSSFKKFVSAGYYEDGWGQGSDIVFDDGIGQE